MKFTDQLPTIEVHHDSKALARKLFDKLAVFVITFGAIPTLGSISRAFRFGWDLNIILDLTTYCSLVTLLLIRRLLPEMVVAVLFILILIIEGCKTFFFSGLITVNLTLLTTGCVVAGALFGFKAGFISLIGSLLVITIPAVLFSTGRLENIYDLTTYLKTPHAWISQLSGYFVYALASLSVVHFIQTHLRSSLSELQHRSDELLASEKKYRLLAENMQDVLLLLDVNLRVTYISPSVFSIFGYTPNEINGKSISILSTRQKNNYLTSIFAQYIKQSPNKQVPLPFECEFQRKDGTCFLAEFTPSLIKSSAGNITGIQGIIRDISERKRVEKEKAFLEEQLHQSEKMQIIGQLAGGIAHDFNNQLAGIMGFAEIIKAENKKDSETYESAQSITTITKSAADLTGKLLAFARKGNYLLSIIDIHDIIGEVMMILSHSINRNITITKKLNAFSSCINGDPAQIQSVLLNIGLNARDAMQTGGTLHFTTESVVLGKDFRTTYQQSCSPGKYIHVTISDTGTGIDESIIDHIFEPFFTTKKPGEGTGMGLAAVYGTIEIHKGLLDIFSTVNKGTAFHIYLPLSEEQPSPVKPSVSPLTSGKGTILLIEDDNNVSKMIALVLKKLGYSLESFANAQQALDYYTERSHEFDAVILDLILPGLSGKEVLKKLRKVNPSVRILLCSGYSIDKDVQKLVTDGKTLFIQKPFTISEFSKKIHSTLNQ